VANSNGTTALHLALMALGVGPGDEVIVPSFTFVASISTIRHCGATPVMIDSRADDWTLDVSQLDSARTPRTKAVMAVDLYGMPCDYDVLVPWCQKNGLALIEDAAEAHGARFAGRAVGSYGDISCFSFFGIVTTGEGGMCLTDDPELYEKMRVLKNHGMTKPGLYEHDVVGYNYRLTNVQAAIGVAQMERIDEFLERRAKNAALYKELLGGESKINFQKFGAEKNPVCWMETVMIDADVAAVAAELAKAEIETRRTFRPMHTQKPYAPFAVGRSFPVAEDLYRRGLNLPSSALLMPEQIKFVCQTLKDAIARVG